MLVLGSETHKKYSAFKKIFVIGAPRSGTTLLHALCCTSPKANDYVSECSFFTGLVRNYVQSLNNLKVHNTDFFGSEEAFKTYNINLFKQFLVDTWESLGNPEILVLKDPQMTARMVEVLQLLQDPLFVVSVRNPQDTLKSRLKVIQKSSGALPANLVQGVIQEYVGFYTLSLRVAELHRAKVKFCCYETLLNLADKNKLAAALGLGEFNEDDLWKPARQNARHFQDKNNPWISEKYGGAISAEKRNEEIDISALAPALGPAVSLYEQAKAKSLI